MHEKCINIINLFLNRLKAKNSWNEIRTFKIIIKTKLFSVNLAIKRYLRRTKKEINDKLQRQNFFCQS